MSKQGQHPAPPGERISEADHQAVVRFRRSIAEARSDLAALTREARSAGGAVGEVVEPTAALTAGAHSLSTAIQTLEFALQEFGRRGTPLYLGPPPASLGDRLLVALFFLLGLCGVGWVLFGPDLDPRRSVHRLSDDPVSVVPALDPVRPPLLPAPPSAPLPADPADLDPVPAPRRLDPGPVPVPERPLTPPARAPLPPPREIVPLPTPIPQPEPPAVR